LQVPSRGSCPFAVIAAAAAAVIKTEKNSLHCQCNKQLSLMIVYIVPILRVSVLAAFHHTLPCNQIMLYFWSENSHVNGT
jgi:hypothetical protein